MFQLSKHKLHSLSVFAYSYQHLTNVEALSSAKPAGVRNSSEVLGPRSRPPMDDRQIACNNSRLYLAVTLAASALQLLRY
eukprot:scaffold313963_cov30-Prasinocladus_malaysianus.AAC.1